MYNHNFNFQGNFTFQPYIPAPPVPPMFYFPPVPVMPSEQDDIKVLKYYESRIPPKQLKPKISVHISHFKDKLQSILVILNDVKNKENDLRVNMNTYSDEEWSSKLIEIEKSKEEITEAMNYINQTDFKILKKLIALRNAKRMRQKRQKIERKADKEQRKKDQEEKSRKIDEYLQKVQDDVNKAKREEAAKAIADTVLKDILRKKQDAKKCLVKLDALIKLRKAKMNTIKGMGEEVSEHEAKAFNEDIENLKLLWTKQLSIYDKEEAYLRAKLAEGEETVSSATEDTEEQMRKTLHEWQVAFFGGTLPQNNFAGDMQRFVSVRYEWDQYVNSEGSPMPMGWVPPQI